MKLPLEKSMKKRSRKRDVLNSLVIGFALFAAFFGAGNLIFPPLLGVNSGRSWFPGFLAFLIADAGLAIAAVLAVVKKSGGLEDQMQMLWKIPSRVLCIVMALIMGPLAVIPRTCATAYEMSIRPLLPGLNSWIFSLIFFGITALLAIRPGKVVDIIGKFLTPVLLLALLVMCVKGIVSPLGPVAESVIPGQEVRTGLTFGYQTMDALLGVPLSVIVIKAVVDKDYEGRKNQAKMISISCLVALAGLAAVYAGLSYLGATVSTLGLQGLSGTELMVEITRRLLQNAGTIMLGGIVLLACLTTAVGVTSAIADYFVGLLKNKIPYWAMVLAFCVLGILLGNLGTSQIIALAGPVLSLLYPVFLTQIFMNLILGKVKNPWVYRGAAIGGFLFALVDLIYSYGVSALQFIEWVPFWNLGLGWVLPAIAGALIGAFCGHKKKADVLPALPDGQPSS